MVLATGRSWHRCAVSLMLRNEMESMSTRLAEILTTMTEADILAFILWCLPRGYLVSPVSHCLWERATK